MCLDCNKLEGVKMKLRDVGSCEILVHVLRKKRLQQGHLSNQLWSLTTLEITDK